MYSAARSRPREGVPRPSSRSEAINERCPRSESAETWSSAAWICGASGACPAVKTQAIRKKTGSLACPLLQDVLMRQIPVGLLLADFLVGVLHVQGKKGPHPVLHVVRQCDRRGSGHDVSVDHFSLPRRDDILQFFACCHSRRNGFVKLRHVLDLPFQDFLASRSAMARKNVVHAELLC